MPPKSTTHNRPITLADVARSAGVSIATASYVLSNRTDVTISAPTRARVHAAASELRYRRNALAAALRTGTAREIGLFAVQRPVGIVADIAFACAEVAATRGYAAVLGIGSAPFLDPGRFDGLVVLGSPPGVGTPALPGDGSVPVVEIGGTATACQVHADDFGGARKAVAHLFALGHRRIAHFAGPQNSAASQERLRGFLDSVHESGLRMEATPVVHSEAELEEILRPTGRPTALLAFNDEAALLTYRHCKRMGFTLPDDLSIVGFGDEDFASSIEPSLTTMRVSPELMAGSAFTLLERQLAREPVPAQTLVPTSMVVRGSTAER